MLIIFKSLVVPLRRLLLIKELSLLCPCTYELFRIYSLILVSDLTPAPHAHRPLYVQATATLRLFRSRRQTVDAVNGRLFAFITLDALPAIQDAAAQRAVTISQNLATGVDLVAEPGQFR